MVVLGLSCPAACGIFLDQGLNLCPLDWQADSDPLYDHGSPTGPVLQHAESSGDMDGDDDCTGMRVFLIPQNCPHKNGNFYVCNDTTIRKEINDE